MKHKIFKKLAIPVMTAAMMMGVFSTTAFAYSDENVEATETTVLEETSKETESTPFSTAGNAQLVDDKTDDDTKQFLTIQTKNGNTFYMILDRSSNTDNVYMLSMIDENDLADFIEESEVEETQTPSVLIPETTQETTEETEETVTAAEQKTSNNNKMLLLIGGIAACGIGGWAAMKYFKSRQEEDYDSEQLEFTDEQFINEDNERKE
jgi:hypothetical protein